MTTAVRPRLPGTLYGLLDAGTRLYQELDASDTLLAEMIAALDTVARAIQRDEDVESLLFEITNTLRIGATGRHFAPHDTA